jgi:hypothetical protein
MVVRRSRSLCFRTSPDASDDSEKHRTTKSKQERVLDRTDFGVTQAFDLVDYDRGIDLASRLIIAWIPVLRLLLAGQAAQCSGNTYMTSVIVNYQVQSRITVSGPRQSLNLEDSMYGIFAEVRGVFSPVKLEDSPTLCPRNRLGAGGEHPRCRCCSDVTPTMPSHLSHEAVDVIVAKANSYDRLVDFRPTDHVSYHHASYRLELRNSDGVSH